MKLFISWSGERSRKLAESLRNWIPKVINAVEPWVSAHDIDPGSRWSAEIAGQLDETKFGIICLTSDNLSSTWLHFESGALSKSVDKSRVVPLLLDNNPADIQGPLSQFQAIKVNKDDLKKLMIAINIAVAGAGEKGIDKTMLEEVFDALWPKLEANLKDIPKSLSKPEESKRSEREMIEELLNLVRSLSRDSVREDSLRLILPLLASMPEKSSAESRKLLAKWFNLQLSSKPISKHYFTTHNLLDDIDILSEKLSEVEAKEPTEKDKKKTDDDDNETEGAAPAR
jgi:hypothetical protein